MTTSSPREDIMHYRNGREAMNGDKIVQLGERFIDGKSVLTIHGIGILYDASPGNDYCNGMVAPITNGGACLVDCLHADDVAAFIAEKGLDKRPAGK
jgi:hypothetical protein